MTLSFDTSIGSDAPPSVTPPAPNPLRDPLRPLAFLRTLRRNPIGDLDAGAFRAPDPQRPAACLESARWSATHPRSAACFSTNAANYRKDALQKRVLAPGLSDGLLTVEGQSWRTQRRAIAPIFTPRIVASFAHPHGTHGRRPRRALGQASPRPRDRCAIAHASRHARRARGDDLLRAVSSVIPTPS